MSSSIEAGRLASWLVRWLVSSPLLNIIISKQYKHAMSAFIVYGRQGRIRSDPSGADIGLYYWPREWMVFNFAVLHVHSISRDCHNKYVRSYCG